MDSNLKVLHGRLLEVVERENPSLRDKIRGEKGLLKIELGKEEKLKPKGKK